MNMYFTAVSNLTFLGFPPGPGRGNPDEQTFPTHEQARAWLKEKGCGGSISNGDRILEEVAPGT